MVTRILRPIYETFKQASKKGGGATPDEIVNWFKENRPNRLEKIMGMNISNARDAYSNAKTTLKKSKNVEKNIKNLTTKAEDFQKDGLIDKPLGAGGK